MASTFNILLTTKTAHCVDAGFGVRAAAPVGEPSMQTVGGADRNRHVLAASGAG